MHRRSVLLTLSRIARRGEFVCVCVCVCGGGGGGGGGGGSVQ